MSAGELYLYINDKLWQLEWCKNDWLESQCILREIGYAMSALKMEEK